MKSIQSFHFGITKLKTVNSELNGATHLKDCNCQLKIYRQNTYINYSHAHFGTFLKNYACSDQDVPSSIVTHMLTQFGQFLDHDIAATPEDGDPHGLIFL